MIRRPPRSTLFPTRRSSDLFQALRQLSRLTNLRQDLAGRWDRQVAALGTPPSAEMGEEVEKTLMQFCDAIDRKSTRLNSSHSQISYAVFCLKNKSDRQFSRRTRRTNLRVRGHACTTAFLQVLLVVVHRTTPTPTRLHAGRSNQPQTRSTHPS